MKKLFTLLFLLTTTIFAQNNNLQGSWIITKAETDSQVDEPYIIIDLKPDGKIETMGMPVANYKYDESNNKIVIDSAMKEKFNGDITILDFTDGKLIVQQNNIKITLIKIDLNATVKRNKDSGLIGTWKIPGEEDETILLEFKEPDEFTFVSQLGGVTDKINGTWIYNNDEKSLIIIGFTELLKGNNKIEKISDTELILKHNDVTITATKVEKPDIERLTFEEEDFDEEADFSDQLPWREFNNMLDSLKGVSFIQYRVGTLIPDVNSFTYSTIFSKINVDSDKRKVSFRNFSITQQDTMQYSENYKDDLAESYNYFFPKSEIFPFRIVGEKSVTVPAGTFDCLVIEGIDGFDKIKYWMIIDKPGIYAKTITEKISVFGDLEYHIAELEIIK